jgi:hypothetical protein
VQENTIHYEIFHRGRMVELVRAGRSVNELAREFEPSASAIRYGSSRPASMKACAARALTPDERAELNHLRRELTTCLHTGRAVRMPRPRVHCKGKSFAGCGRNTREHLSVQAQQGRRRTLVD